MPSVATPQAPTAGAGAMILALSPRRAAAQRAGQITEKELHNLLLLMVGSQGTPPRQVGGSVIAFAGHPDRWRLLSRRPDLIPEAVEEVCRWMPMEGGTWRVADQDIEFRGLIIGAGTTVLFCIVAAARDPRVHKDPERFDITAARRSTPPLLFGGGVYQCVGASAGRLQISQSLKVLTRRFGPPVIEGWLEGWLDGWFPGAAMPHRICLPLRFPPPDAHPEKA